MTQLSPHFSLAELIRSDAAARLGDANRPTTAHLANLTRTAQGMERVRALFDAPITVTSGYRNPKVNAAVGGVPTSAHALGYAVDFHVAGKSDLEAAKVIRDSDLTFDQLIYEAGRCVHLSFDPRDRRQVLRQPGGPGSAVFQGLEP